MPVAWGTEALLSKPRGSPERRCRGIYCLSLAVEVVITSAAGVSSQRAIIDI